MPTTYTQHFHLGIPDFDQTPWHALMASTLNLIDTVIYNALVAQNIQTWMPNTQYRSGDPVIDTLTGLFWTCTTDHISGFGTFAEDRAAHPSYWSINSASIVYDGQWVSGSLYSVGQIINIDYAFYACASSHTAGVFAEDLAMGNWEVIVDLNDAVAETRRNAARTRAAVLDIQRIDKGRVLVSNKASQADAEAGTNDVRWMTPLKVFQAIASYISINLDNLFWSTGDYKLTGKVVADPGWIMAVDGTVGDGASGSTYANNNAQALFTLYFDHYSDANCPIFTQAGASTTRTAQTNAATAWSAHCRVSMPKMLGRGVGVAGAGSGLTSRELGFVVGEEMHTLTATEQATMNLSGTVSVTVNVSGTASVTVSGGISGNASGRRDVVKEDPNGTNVNVLVPTSATTINLPVSGSFSGSGGGSVTASGSGSGSITTGEATGGGAAHNNMGPTSFAFNVMVKL